MATPKQQLLDAPSWLARHGVEPQTVTAAMLAQAAQLDEAAFHAEFKSLDDYLLAAHAAYLDTIMTRIVGGVGSMKASPDRLYGAIEVQLDFVLENTPLRNFWATARRRIPALAQQIFERNHTAGLMLALELRNFGAPESGVAGRYLCMLVLEAAQIEAETGSAVPGARQLLKDFIALSLRKKN